MDVETCPLPEDRLYSLEHEVWWQSEPGDGTARLGILGTLAAFAGRFHGATFRPLEGPVAEGRSLATIESLRFTGAVRSPVDAELVATNSELPLRPRLLNDSPYDAGWVARLRPLRGSDLASRLEPAARIRDRLAEMIRQRRIRCWPKPPEVELPEVGLECSAVLVNLNEALAQRAPGEAVLLVTDDPTSPIEMVRWSDQTGHPVLAHRREGELHQFLVEKLADPQPRRPPGRR